MPAGMVSFWFCGLRNLAGVVFSKMVLKILFLVGFKTDEDDLEEHMGKVLELLAGNPVHVYCLVERLTKRINHVTSEIAVHKDTENTARLIKEMLDQMSLPDEADIEGVTQSISRIQFAYRS